MAHDSDAATIDAINETTSDVGEPPQWGRQPEVHAAKKNKTHPNPQQTINGSRNLTD
jgi:hypothetical protein